MLKYDFRSITDVDTLLIVKKLLNDNAVFLLLKIFKTFSQKVYLSKKNKEITRKINLWYYKNEIINDFCDSYTTNIINVYNKKGGKLEIKNNKFNPNEILNKLLLFSLKFN